MQTKLPAQGLIYFFYFLMHRLITQHHSLQQDSQVEHSVLPQISLWLFHAGQQAWILLYPEEITSDGTNIYVADTDNNKIRKIE